MPFANCMKCIVANWATLTFCGVHRVIFYVAVIIAKVIRVIGPLGSHWDRVKLRKTPQSPVRVVAGCTAFWFPEDATWKMSRFKNWNKLFSVQVLDILKKNHHRGKMILTENIVLVVTLCSLRFHIYPVICKWRVCTMIAYVYPESKFQVCAQIHSKYIVIMILKVAFRVLSTNKVIFPSEGGKSP